MDAVVFWDTDNSGLPSRYQNTTTIRIDLNDFFEAGGLTIKNAKDYPIYIVGCMKNFGSKKKRPLLKLSNIVITDIPAKKENADASDSVLIGEIMNWITLEGSKPSNFPSIILITGDQDFTDTISHLFQKGYNVVICCAKKAMSKTLEWVSDMVLDWGKFNTEASQILIQKSRRLSTPPDGIVLRLKNPDLLLPSQSGLKTFVWWDYSSCGLPDGFVRSYDPNDMSEDIWGPHIQVPHMIQSALKSENMDGPVKVMLYADFTKLTKAQTYGFHHSRIHLRHVPFDLKAGGIWKTLLNELLEFLPIEDVNHVIISNNDFTDAVERLHSNGHHNMMVVAVASLVEDEKYKDRYKTYNLVWRWPHFIYGEPPQRIRREIEERELAESQALLQEAGKRIKKKEKKTRPGKMLENKSQESEGLQDHLSTLDENLIYPPVKEISKLWETLTVSEDVDEKEHKHLLARKSTIEKFKEEQECQLEEKRTEEEARKN